MSPYWQAGSGARRLGSIGLEVRLNDALRVLERAGVRVPTSGRHRQAASILQKWNETPDDLAGAAEDEMREVEEAHRLSWETYIIAVAEYQSGKRRKKLFPLDRLQEFMGGTLRHQGPGDSAREAQFELYVGAILSICSIAVEAAEPDYLFSYGYEKVALAAKRVSSLAPKQLKRHVKKAAAQIGDSGRRGWIAINVDTRFKHVEYTEDEGLLVRSLDSVMDPVSVSLEEMKRDEALLGYLLFGYVVGWWPEAEEAPLKVHWASALRWVGWSDDAGARLHHLDFVDGWRSRFDSRMERLTHKDFDGSL